MNKLQSLLKPSNITHRIFVRFQFVTNVPMTIQAFGDMTSYNLVNSYRRCREACCIYRQMICIKIFLDCLTPRKETARSYQTTVTIHHLMPYHTTEGLTLRSSFITSLKLNSVALVRTRTIPTERPPPVGEVSANFCG